MNAPHSSTKSIHSWSSFTREAAKGGCPTLTLMIPMAIMVRNRAQRARRTIT